MFQILFEKNYNSHNVAIFQSAGKHLLARLRTRCKLGDVSIVVATPDLWNDLPVSLCELTKNTLF